MLLNSFVTISIAINIHFIIYHALILSKVLGTTNNSYIITDIRNNVASQIKMIIVIAVIISVIHWLISNI